jgi:RNA polymerase sigma-70 factor (ECF subfamily)
LNAKFLNGDLYLIRRLRKGDKKSFELIFNKYKERLYFFALGYLHSSVETEEIIQNVFISLWENRNTLIDSNSLKDYLYKMVVNRIYNHFKHQAIRQKYLVHAETQDSLEDDHSQQIIYYNDLKGTIDNLIETLPERQKMVFKLSRYEGLSHKEIADRLGLSVRSVENHIYRALRHIKENLSEEYLLT